MSVITLNTISPVIALSKFTRECDLQRN